MAILICMIKVKWRRVPMAVFTTSWGKLDSLSTKFKRGRMFALEYAEGKHRPRYPVPVTMDTAIISLFNQREVGVWFVQYAKRKLHRNR